MPLPLLMRRIIGFGLKPFCTFRAVPLSQPRQIFYGFGILVPSEVFLVPQVGVNLVEVARVPAGLFLGIATAYGGHLVD